MSLSVSTLTFTDTVNQAFFIESQGGSQQPISLLDRFPDSVYTKSIDSTLVTFLYALLGPAGVGQLTQEFLEARLQIEDAGLSTVDLDAAYASPFSFARLADETYTLDADSSILPAQERAQILAQDASFRNRAQLFLTGIRAGGTLKGLSMVAQSGLNHPVDVIENYRWLWDQYSDAPLGLERYGSTTNLNEVIIIPRQDVPQSAAQVLTLFGNPTSGYFTLSYPSGSDYLVSPIGTTNGSSTLTVTSTANISVGSWISVTGAPTSGAITVSPNPTDYVEVGAILTATTLEAVYPTGSGSAGSAYNMSATGTYWGYIENGRTTRIPYNAKSSDIQTALSLLPVIGGNNVLASGGPLPTNPITVSYVNELSDTPVAVLEINTAPDIISGIGGPSSSSPLVSELCDVTNSPLTITSSVDQTIAGVSTDSQMNAIAPADQHAMEIAVDAIRPQTCFVTTQSATSATQRQPVSGTFASSTFTQVLDYVTGSSKIKWPTVDKTHWIQAGIENEAPQAINTDQSHYQGFHNIAGIQAYTEPALSALQNPYYLDPEDAPAGTQPTWVKFFNIKIGPFSPKQCALVPALRQYTNAIQQYTPSYAASVTPTPLVITNTVDGVNFINYEYPVDYLSLPGVPQLSTSTSLFWASIERTFGIDYLEIDLGTVQAVNYISFDATSKPYSIDVAYDALDMYPQRKFVPVSYLPSSVAPSVTSLAYVNATSNPWSTVTLNVCNAMGGMIYTRVLRIGFTKTPENTPYYPNPQNPIPYSIEVKNLRVGRNVS